MNRIILLVLVSILLVCPVLAEENNEDKKTEIKEEPKYSTTNHSVRIDGQTIKYSATVGWLIMKNDKEEPIARFGYTAYTKDEVSNKSKRPIMFAFNGGPGSSSIWLHMGILGPKRVVVTDEGFTPPPPSECIDNIYSIIDATDLVMIDPVGTGFSKILGEAKYEDFWGVDQDIKSVGAFIKQYITVNGRWASPKYILGESYGGIRSAGLVWYLQSQHNMNFNGIVMVSPFLNMVSGSDGINIDKPHILYLSTLAATAWYHDSIPNKPANLDSFLVEVDQFAYNEYAPALLKGFVITDTEKQAVAKKLASYTGTSTDYWLKADLRVTHLQFLQELKRDERVIAGRIDSRFIGPAVNPLSEQMDYDPFFSSIGPAFTAAFMDYLHTELKFGKDEQYNIWAPIEKWDWQHKSPLFSIWGWPLPWPDMLPDLSMAITTNQGLHVLVQQGYFDLATPRLATIHDIAHLDIASDARERIHIKYYKAGHMMYIHEPSMKKFRNDLATFIRDTDRL